VMGSEEEQLASHRRGLVRLLALELPSPVRAVSDGLSNADKLGLAGSPYASVGELLDDCLLAAVDLLVERQGLVWDEASYDTLMGDVRNGLLDAARVVVRDVVGVLADWRDVDKELSGSADLPMLPALADMKAQVGRLVHRGFVSDVGATQLRQLPRYLGAVRTRRARLAESVGRDRLLMDQVAALQEAYLHRVDALPEGRPAGPGLVAVRWMLEELRVSLWDQARGTAYPVSQARVRKALAAL